MIIILSSSGDALEKFDPSSIQERPEYKSREKLIKMNIDDFLSLCQQGSSNFKKERVDNILEKEGKFDSVPYLLIEDVGGRAYKVVGHEGRHRARKLKDLGYKEMPVYLRTFDIRWSEQNDKSKFDYKRGWPDHLLAEDGAENPHFYIEFPVKRKDANSSYK